MNKRFTPLTTKVNGLILATLILGIGLITVILVTSFQYTVEMNNINSLKNEAQIVYSSVETIMLPGQAELANSLFSRFNQNKSAAIRIFRPDGNQAFIDNKTILVVNQNLKTDRFKPRQNPNTPLTTQEREKFDQVATPNPQVSEVIFTKDVNDKNYAQIFKPLINLPKCTICHGTDHTIRGVLDINFDITESVVSQRNAIFLAFGFFILTVIISALLLANFMRRTVITPVKKIGEVCLEVSQGSFDNKLTIIKNDEIGILSETVNTMINGLLERFKLSKYVSSSTIASIQSSEEGQRVHRVLFFSDVRGFTAFSEKHDAEVVVNELNYLLALQSDIIQHEGGDIDKYVGDEVMAIFKGDHAAAHAVKASLKIQEAIFLKNKTREHKLAIGIGIHEGEVIEGMIGSHKRADFTVIGDTVNLAARLCGSAEGFEILVSEETLPSLKASKAELPDIRLRGPKELSLKGKQFKQKVYSIVVHGDES